jgi:O-antigen/teichoic acid export membrane protein
VWGGTALQIIGRFWGAACTLAILKLADLRLEPAGFGRFTFYLAIFAWLDSLANLGTGPIAVQRSAGHPERLAAVLAGARRIRLGAGLVGVALVGGGAFLLGEPGAPWILVASLYPVTHALELSATVFRNRISWGVPVLARAVASALSLGAVALYFSRGGREPAAYLLAVAIGSACANLLLHLAARPHLPSSRGVAPERGLLRAALPLGLSAICAQTYFYVDNVFVRAIAGEAELGRYNLAVRFMSWSIMLAQYASLTLLPWFTRRHIQGQLAPAVARVGPPLFAVAGFACGAAIPWTTQVLELFGAGYGTAGASLRWLLGAAVAIYAGAILLTALVATGNSRATLAIAAAGVALNVAGNAWAVPALGITGAGLTTFLTEAWVALAAAWALQRSGVALSRHGAWRWLAGPAAFALGGGLSWIAMRLG